MVSVGLKFGPVRDIFEQALRENCGVAGELTASMLHKVLVACVRGCHKLKMPEWTADNAGVQHHSGFLPFAQRIGVLVKEDGAATNGVSVVQLGQMEAAYRVQGFGGDLRARLENFVAKGQQIREHLLRPLVA